MKIPKDILQQVEEDSKKWSERVTKILKDDFNDFDLYVIKCHLILEHELNMYIENRTKNRVSMEKAGFSFTNKIKIAKMLGCFEKEKDYQDLELFLTNLNLIRNQIAHKLTYNKKILKPLLDICKRLNPKMKDFYSKNQKHIFDYAISYFAGRLADKVDLDELSDANTVLKKQFNK